MSTTTHKRSSGPHEANAIDSPVRVRPARATVPTKPLNADELLSKAYWQASFYLCVEILCGPGSVSRVHGSRGRRPAGRQASIRAAPQQRGPSQQLHEVEAAPFGTASPLHKRRWHDD